MDDQEIRLRASHWVALVFGIASALWAIVGKKASVSFDDFYLSASAIVASILLFGLIIYLDLPLDAKKPKDPDHPRGNRRLQ
jgi:putative Mn2+ efflux pump MntP